MGAEEYIVHRHYSATLRKDKLTVWRPVNPGDLPVIQIDQNNDVTASVTYRPEDAVALAQGILDAAGLDSTITIAP